MFNMPKGPFYVAKLESTRLPGLRRANGAILARVTLRFDAIHSAMLRKERMNSGKSGPPYVVIDRDFRIINCLGHYADSGMPLRGKG